MSASQQNSTVTRGEKNGAYWIGKGLATIGVWAGCGLLGYLGLIIIIGPIFALMAGVLGTMAIWCPDVLKKISF